MYQVIEGIVKVVKPKGKAVIGIADGNGLFIWLGFDIIMGSFPPQPYHNWQTTRFLLPLDYTVNWKPERNWDQYKGSYTDQNIIPIPTPMPAEFAIEPQLSLHTGGVYNVAPPNIPATSVLPIIQPQHEPTMIYPVSGSATPPINSTYDILTGIDDKISKILKLFQKYMKAPEIVTADTLLVEEIIEEYGIPPDEEGEVIDFDGLPEV